MRDLTAHPPRHGPPGPILALAVALAAASGCAVWEWFAPGDGPAEVAWDKAECAHCHMHLGDPAFAAQLRDANGEVLFFDDPGCLFRHLDRMAGPARALYFRSSRDESWIADTAVAFVPGSRTPMGFGFAAVPAGTPGAVSLEEARRAVTGRGGGAP